MNKYLKLAFNDEKGVTCNHCMLSFSKGDRNHCAALGIRPFCPEDGCRKDCPLKSMETNNGNHGITIEEAYKHPTVKVHQEVINEKGEK